MYRCERRRGVRPRHMHQDSALGREEQTSPFGSGTKRKKGDAGWLTLSNVWTIACLTGEDVERWSVLAERWRWRGRWRWKWGRASPLPLPYLLSQLFLQPPASCPTLSVLINVFVSRPKSLVALPILLSIPATVSVWYAIQIDVRACRRSSSIRLRPAALLIHPIWSGQILNRRVNRWCLRDVMRPLDGSKVGLPRGISK